MLLFTLFWFNRMLSNFWFFHPVHRYRFPTLTILIAGIRPRLCLSSYLKWPYIEICLHCPCQSKHDIKDSKTPKPTVQKVPSTHIFCKQYEETDKPALDSGRYCRIRIDTQDRYIIGIFIAWLCLGASTFLYIITMLSIL